MIVIGNEVLSGRTREANVATIAKGLDDLGIPLNEVRIIADDQAAIVAAINALRFTHDYVFTSGGIGATHDDITACAIAAAFDLPFGRHADAYNRLIAHYGDDINDVRAKMADMPEGATLINNPVSGAPGFQVGNVYVMAGVPKILSAMFDEIKDSLSGGVKRVSRSLGTRLTEGLFAAELTAVADAHGDVEIGSYPFFRVGGEKGPKGIGVNLVVRAVDGAAVDAAIADLKVMIKSLGGEAFDGEIS